MGVVNGASIELYAIDGLPSFSAERVDSSATKNPGLAEASLNHVIESDFLSAPYESHSNKTNT